MIFIHIMIALIVQTLVGLATGNWWAGAAWGAGFYLGREIAQAEYRWIEAFGYGRRANMPWWGPLDPRVWRKFDAWADWVGPALAVVIVAGLVA